MDIVIHLAPEVKHLLYSHQMWAGADVFELFSTCRVHRETLQPSSCLSEWLERVQLEVLFWSSSPSIKPFSTLPLHSTNLTQLEVKSSGVEFAASVTSGGALRSTCNVRHIFYLYSIIFFLRVGEKIGAKRSDAVTDRVP